MCCACLLSAWTEEPGKLQSTGSQRVGYSWAYACTHSGQPASHFGKRKDYTGQSETSWWPSDQDLAPSPLWPKFNPWSGNEDPANCTVPSKYKEGNGKQQPPQLSVSRGQQAARWLRRRLKWGSARLGNNAREMPHQWQCLFNKYSWCAHHGQGIVPGSYSRKKVWEL